MSRRTFDQSFAKLDLFHMPVAREWSKNRRDCKDKESSLQYHFQIGLPLSFPFSNQMAALGFVGITS